MTTTVRITHEGPDHHNVRIGQWDVRPIGAGHTNSEVAWAEIQPGETWIGVIYEGRQLNIEEGKKR